MDSRDEVKKRLEKLLAQRDAAFQRHSALSQEREALGAQINAIDGAITIAREILGPDAPPQKPPTRQQKRATARKR